MPRGVIKYFNDSRGYGFIESDEKESVYVHYSAIREAGYQTLQEGQKVWFDVREGQRGLEAVNVHKLHGD